jgi:hypothetical protein
MLDTSMAQYQANQTNALGSHTQRTPVALPRQQSHALRHPSIDRSAPSPCAV